MPQQKRKISEKARRALQQLIKDVEVKMEKRGDDKTALAKYMGKTYQQVWDWMNFKKGTPAGDAVVLFQSYLKLSDEKPKPPEPVTFFN